MSRPTSSTREMSIWLGKFIRCFERETRMHVQALVGTLPGITFRYCDLIS